MSVRSEEWVCSRLITEIAVSTLAGVTDVHLLCLLVVRCAGPCERLRILSEEAYRVYVCRIVCDIETSIMRPPTPDFGCYATENTTCCVVGKL